MKKLVLTLAAILMLVTATVPSFADGDPGPRKATQCPLGTCLPPA